jgi:hypothetical protein
MLPSLAAPGVANLALEAHVPGRYIAATVGQVITFYWSGDADRSSMKFLDQLLEKLTAGHKKPASAVHVVHERVSLPDAAVRSDLMELMQRYAPTTGCFGIVLLGAGFWASAMRSALTGVRMLTPGAPPMKFAQSVDEVLPWFCVTHQERTDQALDAAQLSAALRYLRETAEGARR